MTQFYHGELGTAAAEGMIRGAMNGTFLVRDAGEKKGWILNVAVGKLGSTTKPSQHLVTTAQNGDLILNKKKTPCKTMRDLIQLLRTPNKQLNWPIRLTSGITKN